MPSCRNCHRFDAAKNCCTVDGPLCGLPGISLGRKCVIASLELRLASIRNKIICEIGPGIWTFTKEMVEANGNEWFGVEPQEVDYRGQPTVRTHDGTVSELPFSDESVDVVIANQSMEHWHEFGTPFRQAFAEIVRVLRPSGYVIINVPIYKHGHPIFLRGELDKIRSLFSAQLWSSVKFEEWRRDFKPLNRWLGWEQASSKDQRQIPNPKSASTWILEIVATKASEPGGTFRFELGPRWIDLKSSLNRNVERARNRLATSATLRKLYRKLRPR